MMSKDWRGPEMDEKADGPDTPTEAQAQEINALIEAILQTSDGKDAQIYGTALMYVAAMVVKTQFPDNERAATDSLCDLLRVLVDRGVVTAGMGSVQEEHA